MSNNSNTMNQNYKNKSINVQIHSKTPPRLFGTAAAHEQEVEKDSHDKISHIITLTRYFLQDCERHDF